MAGRVFHLNENGNATPLEEHPYDAEKTLQELLAQHPDLMAGEQIDSTAPRRWLLITREMAVPGDDDAGGKWSLDHLFLDQDGIPTLVEVKRSTNTDIRRKVVGQMLDYAANAVAYWPVEQIRAKYEARCQAAGIDPDEELGNCLGEEHDQENFWQQVKTNLQAGKVRLVFIADMIPPELRRIVEFLNEQMDPAEVLALEIKQYVGEGMKTLVPRIFGHKIKPPRPSQGPKFDITLGTTTEKAVPRTAAFFKIVKYLCDVKKITPEEIAKQVTWRSIYIDVDGEVDSDKFAVLCAAKPGKKFDPDKFFCADGQLVHSAGRTYAFAQKWGALLPKALKNITAAFAEKGVACVKSPET